MSTVVNEGALLTIGDLDLLRDLFLGYGRYHLLVFVGLHIFTTRGSPLQRCSNGLMRSRGARREHLTNILYS
jgi:hypothetical protein